MGKNDAFVGLGELKKAPSLRKWEKMPIGKYKGDYLEDILETDPEYLVWFSENVTHYNLAPDIMAELSERQPADALNFEDDDILLDWAVRKW